MAGERVGRLLADRAQLRVVHRASVGAGREQHLEKNVHRVCRGEDDQRGSLQVLDCIADAVVGGQASDLDRRDLDHRGAEVDELAAERVDLVARTGDQDAAPVERALRQGVQPLRHLHARSEHQQRVAAKPIGGGLACQLSERGTDAMLARLAGIEDQRSRRVRCSAVLQQRGDA